MVRWFVQDQQIGGRYQGSGQSHAPLLTAAHALNGIDASLTHTKPVENSRGLPRVADCFECGDVVIECRALEQ